MYIQYLSFSTLFWTAPQLHKDLQWKIFNQFFIYKMVPVINQYKIPMANNWDTVFLDVPYLYTFLVSRCLTFISYFLQGRLQKFLYKIVNISVRSGSLNPKIKQTPSKLSSFSRTATHSVTYSINNTLAQQPVCYWCKLELKSLQCFTKIYIKK
jgi:hypothetical protein